MGNEYNRFNNHQNQHLDPRATFLPMLCSRTSIKDVVLPSWKDRSASFSDDPLSPKIGCMGQVKRNNRVVGFPVTSSHKHITNNNNNNNAAKYSKLKKLFSGKNLATPTTVAAAASCRIRRQVDVNSASEPKSNHRSESCVSVVDMDPPLPVIKRPVQKPEAGEGENLWKRRSGGVALKTLQLQQIHHPKHRLQPTTV